MQSVWRKGTIPSCWKKADVCFMPKELLNRWTISNNFTLTVCVEGNIFFSVLTKRMTSWERTDIIPSTLLQRKMESEATQDALNTSSPQSFNPGGQSQKRQSDLSGWIWLMPMEQSCPHASIHLWFKTAKLATQWHNLEKGIVAGCNISTILFITGMNLIIIAMVKNYACLHGRVGGQNDA